MVLQQSEHCFTMKRISFVNKTLLFQLSCLILLEKFLIWFSVVMGIWCWFKTISQFSVLHLCNRWSNNCWDYFSFVNNFLIENIGSFLLQIMWLYSIKKKSKGRQNSSLIQGMDVIPEMLAVSIKDKWLYLTAHLWFLKLNFHINWQVIETSNVIEQRP